MASITCWLTYAPRQATLRRSFLSARPRSVESRSEVKATLSKWRPALRASSSSLTPSTITRWYSPPLRTRRNRLTSGFWRLVIFSTSISRGFSSPVSKKPAAKDIDRPAFHGEWRKAQEAKHRHLKQFHVAEVRHSIRPFRKDRKS